MDNRIPWYALTYDASPIVTWYPRRRNGKLGRPEQTTRGLCPLCFANALVAFPRFIAKRQTDGTTHVCHPGMGGCNRGFSTESR